MGLRWGLERKTKDGLLSAYQGLPFEVRHGFSA